jgi:hypothetical protein
MEVSGRYGKWHQWCRGNEGLRKTGWQCATTRLWRIRWNIRLVGPTQRCNTIVQFHRRRCERFARLESASRTQVETQTEHRLSSLLSCRQTSSDYAQERQHDHHDHRKFFVYRKVDVCIYSVGQWWMHFWDIKNPKFTGGGSHDLSHLQNSNICACTALHSAVSIWISADMVFVLRISRKTRPLAETSTSESDILLKSSHHNIILLFSASVSIWAHYEAWETW